MRAERWSEVISCGPDEEMHSQLRCVTESQPGSRARLSSSAHLLAVPAPVPSCAPRSPTRAATHLGTAAGNPSQQPVWPSRPAVLGSSWSRDRGPSWGPAVPVPPRPVPLPAPRSPPGAAGRGQEACAPLHEPRRAPSLGAQQAAPSSGAGNQAPWSRVEQRMPSALSPELAAGRPCCISCCHRGAARMASCQALTASAQARLPGRNCHSEHGCQAFGSLTAPSHGTSHVRMAQGGSGGGRQGTMGAVFCYAHEASLSAGSLWGFLCWGHSHILVLTHPSHVAVLAFLSLLSATRMSPQEAISAPTPGAILC